MRKLIWTIVFVFGYVWSVTSGNDQFIYRQAKKVYSALSTWLEDAELDFQVRKPPSVEKREVKKKNPKRWN